MLINTNNSKGENDPLVSVAAVFGNGVRDSLEVELRHGFELERKMAFARQRRLAQANQRISRRMVEGLGKVEIAIDPFLKALAERQFGQGCFGDKNFRRELLRDNPELRPKTAKKTIVKGWR